jgi:L-glutamine-phosphate cytidylyltransferase
LDGLDLNAIILAAGKGERLRPLTNDKPKCLVELFGKSLLEWQINSFQSFGITDITVVTGYMSNKIDFPSVNIIKNENFDSTNMVETLFCAEEKFTDSTIISYGDIIFESSILKKLISSQHDFSIIIDKNWLNYWKLRFENPLDDAESLELNSDGYLTSIGQKIFDITKIQGQYIGLMKFQNSGISNLQKFYHDAKNKAKSGKNPLNDKVDFKKSYMTDLLNSMILENFNLKAIEIQNGWLELDSINDLKIYEKMDQKKTLKNIFNSTK